MSAGAGLITRGANFDYKTGPDGQRYAVGGDVQIDVSPEKEPEDTIAKARRIQGAALAPADPSPQDFRVAAKAVAMASQAQMELSKQRAEEAESQDGGGREISIPGMAGGDSQNAGQPLGEMIDLSRVISAGNAYQGMMGSLNNINNSPGIMLAA